jgi:hypothetical protein
MRCGLNCASSKMRNLLKERYDIVAARFLSLLDNFELKAETAEAHTTPQYIWRTKKDGHVRPEHAALDGKVFSWDNPPPTGNPGEAYGCRCWAEACGQDVLREQAIQTVTFALPDSWWSWTNVEIGYHYFFGKGVDKTLHEIGLLQSIITHAREADQPEAGGGSIFERVQTQIFTKARERGEGNFVVTFKNGYYDFKPVVWAFGHVPVSGEVDVHVKENGNYLIITAYIDYHFHDHMGDIAGTYDGRINPGVDLPSGVPYEITGDWSTRLEAVILKESSSSKYPSTDIVIK